MIDLFARLGIAGLLGVAAIVGVAAVAFFAGLIVGQLIAWAREWRWQNRPD